MASEDFRRSDARVRAGVPAAILVALAIVVYGGYDRHWSWIGINGQTATLWDWLHLMLLPLAVVVLPLWLSRRTRVDRLTKTVAGGLGAVFAVVVIAGYTIPWAWTGFVGNSLWDWLNLIALPVTVALIPVAVEMRLVWTRRYSLIALAGAAVFAAIVLGAYLGKWRWTGFTGNTLWDWLHLLLLPLLVPTVVVPALRSLAMARVELLDEQDEQEEENEQEDLGVASVPVTPADPTGGRADV
jgi:hypothetical protein